MMNEYQKKLEYFKNKLTVIDFKNNYLEISRIFQKLKQELNPELQQKLDQGLITEDQAISQQDKSNFSYNKNACSKITTLFYLQNMSKKQVTHIKCFGDQNIGNHYDGKFYMKDEANEKVTISSLTDPEFMKNTKEKDLIKIQSITDPIQKNTAIYTKMPFIIDCMVQALKNKNDHKKYKDTNILIITYKPFMQFEAFVRDDIKKYIFFALETEHKELLDSVKKIFKEIWFVPIGSFDEQCNINNHYSFCLGNYWYINKFKIEYNENKNFTHAEGAGALLDFDKIKSNINKNFIRTTGTATLLELQIKLLILRDDPKISKSKIESCKELQKTVFEKYNDHLSQEDKKVIKKAVYLRNRIVHFEFSKLLKKKNQTDIILINGTNKGKPVYENSSFYEQWLTFAYNPTRLKDIENSINKALDIIFKLADIKRKTR